MWGCLRRGVFLEGVVGFVFDRCERFSFLCGGGNDVEL